MQVSRRCKLAQAGADGLMARASCCGVLTCVTLRVRVQPLVLPAASTAVSHDASAYGAPLASVKADRPTLPPLVMVIGQLTGVLPATAKQAEHKPVRHAYIRAARRFVNCQHRATSPNRPRSSLWCQHAHHVVSTCTS
jgi:hypothetical protein